MTEQRTEAMSDERLESLQKAVRSGVPNSPCITVKGFFRDAAWDLLAEVKRLRSQETSLAHGAVDLAEEMKAAENVRLRQEIEQLRGALAIRATRIASENAKQESDTLLLDKLARKLFADHRLICGYCVDGYEIASGLQVEAAGPTLREAIAALEEK